MQERNDNYVLPERIALADAKRFVLAWHYSKIFPPHCLVNLALRDDSGALCAVAMWGWGVRPKHTIQRLFPGLDTPDYLELNRLCLREDQPRNSESRFLSLCAEWIRENTPHVKLLFSWADGLRGKPGYVYQAASWLYGGFIKTDLYVDEHGGPIHPRLMITRLGSRSRKIWTAHGLNKWLCGIPHNHFYADFWIMRSTVFRARYGGGKRPPYPKSSPHNHSPSRKRSNASLAWKRRRGALVSCRAFKALSFISMLEVM
jgi:hypothetical protein